MKHKQLKLDLKNEVTLYLRINMNKTCIEPSKENNEVPHPIGLQT